MREKKKQPPQSESRCRYSVLQNICYCLKNTCRCCPSLIWWCALAIPLRAAPSLLAVYLPKAVVGALAAKESLPELLMAVLFPAGALALLSGADKFFTRYIYQQKYRMNSFYLKQAAMKGLNTDYCNQEQEAFRRLQTEAFSCCSGNGSPLSNIYELLITLCSALLGLSVFWAVLIQLGGFVSVFLAAAAAGGYFLNRRSLKWAKINSGERIGYQQRLRYIGRVSGDIRSGKDIRLYRLDGWFSDIYRQNMRRLAGWYRRLTKRLFGAAVCGSALTLLQESAVYLYLIRLVWEGRISAADFVLYFGVVTGFSAWMGDIFSQLAELFRLSLQIDGFRAYLEYPETYRRKGGIDIPAGRLPKEIELRGVSYRYAGSGQAALQNIHLKISPKEHLAIVGMNGAGKTTLIKLICGLIDPTEGQVLYDGVDIREYDRPAFYRLFSAVNQQFSILPASIEEIVSEQPAEKSDPLKVRDCLAAAGLWEKTARLSQGTKSRFGKTVYEDGVTFSGGETQKLLLARALYKDAPVLLLDEPTAALDPIAESRLYESYHQMSEGKTSLFISHRLASTRFCSRILLLENGRIQEEGTHESLLRQQGSYARLFLLQAKYYRENTVSGEEKK